MIHRPPFFLLINPLTLNSGRSFDSDKVICTPKIQLCEKRGFLELLDSQLNQWKRVWILHHDHIEPLIINGGPETPVLQPCWSHWRRSHNYSLFHCFRNIFLCGAGKEIYHTVPGSMLGKRCGFNRTEHLRELSVFRWNLNQNMGEWTLDSHTIELEIRVLTSCCAL